MASPRGFFSISIGKKYVMGITGLGLALFVLFHMLENLLLIAPAEAYNRYSDFLITNPAIYLAEAGLLAIFVLHLVYAIWLTIQNRRARPSRYAMTTNGDKGVSAASKTMIHTGIVVLIFIVIHLMNFKYGAYYEVTYGGVTMRDLRRTVTAIFSNGAYVAWYVVAVLLLGFHLSHGVSSAFQSLGWNHPKYMPTIKRIGMIFGIVVALGFAFEPLYVYFSLTH